MIKNKMIAVFLSKLIINRIRLYGCIAFIVLFLIASTNLSGQRHCTNPPTVQLSRTSGMTCIVEPITVTGNTFGGGATMVTITEDGNGSLTPSESYSSPFSFTYTPDETDAGRRITITVTTNVQIGSKCKAARATFVLEVIESPAAPVIEGISQTTCTSSTGNITLGGLPPSAEWVVTINPGGMTITGTGTTTTIYALSSGSYTFTLSLAGGCISQPSEAAVIREQPSTPSPPIAGTITAPTCSENTGNVMLTNLPSPVAWTLTRYPGTVTFSGSGSSAIVSDLPSGSYYFTVTNEAGCVSGLSASVTIPGQPPIPSTPLIGTVTQPTLAIPTGSVTLNGLPPSGTWMIIRSPDDVLISGSGTTFTVTGIEAGTYSFKVTNNFGCSSQASEYVVISAPGLPVLVINDPPSVCFPSTVDITAPEITSGSTSGLVYTYWTDADAKKTFATPASSTEGTYYIKGTSESGYFDIKPVMVKVDHQAVPNAGPDQILAYQYSTTLEAELGENETGFWLPDSENVLVSDITDPRSMVSNLSPGENILSWIVTKGSCPADTDKVIITVGEIVISTLITPNGDSKNEYLVIKGIEELGKTELMIFDRRGVLVFRKTDYDNKWNGADYNNNPLASDTYFFVIKSENGKYISGYVMLRR